jgi:ClpP class serine protease
MTDPLSDLRRADAHARWTAADALALRPEAAAQLAAAPVLCAGWMDDCEDDEDCDEYTVVNGVAVVPVEGALMDRAGWWWDGYDAIAARVEKAHADASVRAVMLDLDSPGGMVAGLFECMAALRAARAASGKRMVAWVGSGAYSAAYSLASVCDEIATGVTAGTGSVGVIASLVSRAAQFTAEGVDVRVVSSGVEKTDGHPALPISDAAEGRLRARVGELSAMLFDEVRIGRAGLTTDALMALDGGVRYGRAAVAAGLADRIATRAALLAELAQKAPAGSHASSTSRVSSGRDLASMAPTKVTDDRGFIDAMIPHHETALAMVDEADGKLKNSDLKKLAAGIKATQAAEIEEMRRILATLPAEKKSARPDTGLATAPATSATAASRGTTAGPTGRAQRTTMDDTLLAAIAAATGETDPAKAAGALASLKTRADGAEQSLAQMTAERATLAARAEAAEKRADAMERSAEIEAAKASGQWTPALDSFLATLSVSQLRVWRESATRAVPAGEIKAPAEAPRADSQLAPEVAEIVAKARTGGGWKALSPAEKHALTASNPKLAAEIRAGR